MEHEHINPDDAAAEGADCLELQRSDIERIKDYCQKLGEGISSAADLLLEMRERLAEMDLRLRKLEAGRDG